MTRKLLLLYIITATACRQQTGTDSQTLMIMERGNGVKASDPDHPEVGASFNSKGEEVCTVTLVHPHYVVTASHCIGKAGPQKLNGPKIKIKGKDYTAIASNSPQDMESMRFCYDSHGLKCGKTAYKLDFAILRLNEDVKNVSPAKFENPVNLEFVKIYGFGCSSEKEEEDGVNRKVGRGKRRMYEGKWDNPATSNFRINVTCTGDSGGPVFNAKTGKLVYLMSQGKQDNGGGTDTFASVGENSELVRGLVKGLGDQEAFNLLELQSAHSNTIGNDTKHSPNDP